MDPTHWPGGHAVPLDSLGAAWAVGLKISPQCSPAQAQQVVICNSVGGGGGAGSSIFLSYE